MPLIEVKHDVSIKTSSFTSIIPISVDTGDGDLSHFFLIFSIFLGNVRHRIYIAKQVSKWMSAISLDGRDGEYRR